MNYGKPVSELIRGRFSCRTYTAQPISVEAQQQLRDSMASIDTGPFGTSLRFELIAATAEDRAALRGLGTYGFIRGASGFLVGAASRGAKDLEDYGYAMESIILAATALDLGTCWLGGTFTRSSFARTIDLSSDENMPAVTSVGIMADPERAKKGLVRRLAKSASRLPWQSLFFNRTFESPLSQEEAGDFTQVLELVRLAPSASNKQPWRVVKDGELWHFYIERTPGYGKSPAMKLLSKKGERFPDIQRLDLGIAICHFDLVARELGLPGQWVVDEPAFPRSSESRAYVASFVA